MCLGLDSAWMSDVATLDPGWYMKKPISELSLGSVKDSCSCPHITRLKKEGIKDSGRNDFRLLPILSN